MKNIVFTLTICLLQAMLFAQKVKMACVGNSITYGLDKQAVKETPIRHNYSTLTDLIRIDIE